MTAILKSIDDPRDALDRARRPELIKFARANGIKDINEQMPAMLIRRRLRSKGLTRIPVEYRPLGGPPAVPAFNDAIVSGESGGKEIDALDDMERQYKAPPPPKRVIDMSINELRAEMKRRDIPGDIRDNMITMRAKIEAHGQQDAAQRSQ